MVQVCSGLSSSQLAVHPRFEVVQDRQRVLLTPKRDGGEITLTLQVLARASALAVLSDCSGDMYSGVPSIVPSCVRPLWSFSLVAFAKPKSNIFNYSCPSAL